MSNDQPTTIDASDIRIEGELELSPAALRALAVLLVDAALREIEQESGEAA